VVEREQYHRRLTGTSAVDAAMRMAQPRDLVVVSPISSTTSGSRSPRSAVVSPVDSDSTAA
jgi:hypothetical protein